MKVRRLCWLGVRTEAFDETTAFFRDVLGLPMGYEESGFSMFALPDADRDFVEVFSPARRTSPRPTRRHRSWGSSSTTSSRQEKSSRPRVSS